MGLVSHMVPDVKQFIHLEPLTITKNMDIAQKRVVKFLTLLKDSKSAFSKLPESNLLGTTFIYPIMLIIACNLRSIQCDYPTHSRIRRGSSGKAWG